MSGTGSHADERIAQLSAKVRDIPDFPKPGILFRDVTPLLADAASLRLALTLLAERVAPQKPELIVGIEARGFIFGAALADRMGVGFVPVRKPGKLPYRAARETYALEYGQDTLEMHEDAVDGRRCVVVDDLLATGGTASAAGRLITRQGGRVEGFAFLIELTFLPGRKALGDRVVETVIQY